MADSDNTTALPFVTPGRRGKSCAVDDKSKAGIETIDASLEKTIPARLIAPIDPCVVLLQDWEQAHHMAVVLCRLQQRLETRIRNTLRFPGVSGESGGDTAKAAAEAQGQAADNPAPGNDSVSGNMSAMSATQADQQRRWDALDVEVGYSRVRAAEMQAVEAEEEILAAVAATPAQSLAGVIAKLKIIVGGGETAEETSAFPWPQIQSVLADLKDLGESDAHVLPRPQDGRLGDNQSGDNRSMDGQTGRLRAFLSDGDPAVGRHPRQS
ncbi:hypothetical protein [Aminobacter niigataensis]|uniref:hypothetical protein n=1 Tax=Aminobacter niigataensis TaxID=83265 RepID=UPI00228440F7|nr:hypothetical protein [Aminobacter niigataensis]CAI2936495.1 IncF plasmid conjugative transfer protein TraG [Aminobacter niigataensis]